MRHRLIFESGEFDTEISKLFFYSHLSPIDVRKNQHMKFVNIHPFDLDENEVGDSCQPNLVDFAGNEKKKMTDFFVSVFKKLPKYQIQTGSKMRTRY